MFIYKEDKEHWRFQEKEYNGFTKLYCFVNYLYTQNDLEAIFRFVYCDKVILAKYCTMYETDNGLEISEGGYEEFNAIAFENLETHECFEINYLNLPQEIYCNDEKIL